MRARRALWALAGAAMVAAGCTALVNGKLNKKPEHGDGSIGGPCMSPADCNDGNACNGAEQCTMGMCVPGTRAVDGAACDADANPMTHDICVMAMCVHGMCGDRIVDPMGMPHEECDDGNTTNDDGCDNDCTFSCTVDLDCNDMDPCNGIERCGTGGDMGALHVCQPGRLDEPDGTVCNRVGGSPGHCMGGMCI